LLTVEYLCQGQSVRAGVFLWDFPRRVFDKQSTQSDANYKMETSKVKYKIQKRKKKEKKERVGPLTLRVALAPFTRRKGAARANRS
jgi:hypothetical protein